jgi:hypothetical protein
MSKRSHIVDMNILSFFLSLVLRYLLHELYVSLGSHTLFISITAEIQEEISDNGETETFPVVRTRHCYDGSLFTVQRKAHSRSEMSVSTCRPLSDVKYESVVHTKQK